jgi:hypothetical protein
MQTNYLLIDYSRSSSKWTLTISVLKGKGVFSVGPTIDLPWADVKLLEEHNIGFTSKGAQVFESYTSKKPVNIF